MAWVTMSQLTLFGSRSVKPPSSPHLHRLTMTISSKPCGSVRRITKRAVINVFIQMSTQLIFFVDGVRVGGWVNGNLS